MKIINFRPAHVSSGDSTPCHARKNLTPSTSNTPSFGGRVYSPYEVLAVTTERRLLEKSRYELVVFDVVDVFLLQGPLAPTQPQPEFGVHVAGVVLLHVPVVLGHLGCGSFGRTTGQQVCAGTRRMDDSAVGPCRTGPVRRCWTDKETEARLCETDADGAHRWRRSTGEAITDCRAATGDRPRDRSAAPAAGPEHSASCGALGIVVRFDERAIIQISPKPPT